MANRLTNEEVKIAFFSKDGGDPKPVSTKTFEIIVSGIRHGIERCVDKGRDVDMYCCLQGNRFIPNSNTIVLHNLDASLLSSSTNGNLRFITNQGGHTLNVIFSGGASIFKMTYKRVAAAAAPVPAAAAPVPAAAAPVPAPAPATDARKTNGCQGRRRTAGATRPHPEEMMPAERTLPRTRQRRRMPPPPPIDSDSSAAEEMNEFSQLTGRGRRS
ncbi:hypothetical protein SEMRO_397_G134390.1 [Seminavis robusta]|uniref:Uncharacterized protein n=1 Tax=Seminavis robusta TaxID=568900 RepID=A0A9N8HEB3_9STRA|nr:hypothetical protein SEMRO_397_G134390.1 [Seminavis robusta]|eukprot:Sro397_g134390.1 n/a (215) ;mRNA; f:2851-3495